jgi:3-dehydroquinate dehydratase/shikimate dehydrogenase
MGKLGKISRLLSPLFGGFLTFAALERKSETASGQMTIQEMKELYSLLGH